jgi:hypothetical protein
LQLRTYGNGIGISVILMGSHRTRLDISPKDELIIPAGISPGEFSVVITANEGILVNQKDVGTDGGGYHSIPEVVPNTYVLGSIVVSGISGGPMRTAWHQKASNRADCWIWNETDHILSLFQPGVVSRTQGKTWRVLGEYRWQGKIYRHGGTIAARPEISAWGSFGSRMPILRYPGFTKLIGFESLPEWTGTEEELNPPLDQCPPGKFARVDWFNTFAGNEGQGIVVLGDGRKAWVHGDHLNIRPDADGIKRIWRNQLIQYENIEYNWGSKPGLPRLKGATLKKF